MAYKKKIVLVGVNMSGEEFPGVFSLFFSTRAEAEDWILSQQKKLYERFKVEESYVWVNER